MKTVIVGRVRQLKPEGAFAFVPKGRVSKHALIFKNNDVVKIEIDRKNRRAVMSVPKWSEMVNWKEMPEFFNNLHPKPQETIRTTGAAPTSRDK